MQATYIGWVTGTPDETAQIFPKSTDPPPSTPQGLGTLEVDLVTVEYFPYKEVTTPLTVHFITTNEAHAHQVEREGATSTTLFVGIPTGWRKSLTITGIMDADVTLLTFHTEAIAPSELWNDYTTQTQNGRAFYMELK